MNGHKDDDPYSGTPLNGWSHKAKPEDRAAKLGLSSSRFKHKRITEEAAERIATIKRKHRSDLKEEDWGKYSFYKTDALVELFKGCPDQIERVSAAKLTPEDFAAKYEGKAKPLVIKGATEGWNVSKYWTFEAVYDRYKDVRFKIGEDDEGYKLKIRMKYFLEYLIHQKDDSPLYLFESGVEDIREAKDIIKHYKVPSVFPDDFFSLPVKLGEEKRPPYRWFLIGPQRSGTTVHTDPLNTSAWNASLQGHKRWVLFPEHVPKGVVKGKEFIKDDDDDEPLFYFNTILPKIKEKEGANLGIIEFIQYPGETVFIPGGWWHAVINLDNTIAVTQNFVSRTNFADVWRSVRKERKRLSTKFLERLKAKKPAFAETAISMNKTDSFVMHDERKKLLEKRKRDGNGANDPAAEKRVNMGDSPFAHSEESLTSSSSSSSDSDSEDSSD